MYEAYWGLTARPFEPNGGDGLYYPGEAHQGALLKLRYAIEHRRGAALLTGASGMGKTYLVQQLARQLSPDCAPIARLIFPQMPADQLVAYLAEEVTGAESTTEATFSLQQNFRRLQRALLANAKEGRHAVVVIDDAQVLQEPETLEAVRLLLNLSDHGAPLMTMLLVAQPHLLTTLQRAPELDDRLDVKCLLPRFTVEQTQEYVAHRLREVGATRPLFHPDALIELHDASEGVPRRINRLADLALLVGYAEELLQIGLAQIVSVADELLAGTVEHG